MRIICPACAAAYEVPDRLIGSGRSLRCKTCGHGWRVEPEGGAPESPPAALPVPPPAPPALPDPGPLSDAPPLAVPPGLPPAPAGRRS
ncbi:zinc-ribbon domain-containing protein [Dankookia sp. P2]|uniref:zinc-ribbon domain-containing protein n=1 Tax=Dankookia sp. P2 TaxID=3423955 RepID=UPI003D669929